MASPNTSEIISTTLRHRSGKVVDNVTKNNALYYKLAKKGNLKLVSGGRNIMQELEYAENGTPMWYSGYEVLNISPSDVISAAEFDWKQLAASVSISGLEELQNSGPDAVVDLLAARIKNAEHTLENTMAQGTYAAGTGSGGKELGGLQLLVADAPSTGTVGGINRANFSFWRNYSFDATTDGGAAATAANIQSYMHTVALNVQRGKDATDLIPADNNYYKLFWESMTAIQRINESDMATAGFRALKFVNADVVFDGGYGGFAPTNHMYFLNTNYIYLKAHKDRNMTPLGERVSVNQDATVKIIAWAGALCISNCFLQGILKD